MIFRSLMAKQAFKQNASWCLHKTNIITFNHCQARSNSTTHMYYPSGGIPRPKAKGGRDCFFTFGGLLCTWPVKLSYRNQSPNCIDIMSSRVLHLPSVCTMYVLVVTTPTSTSCLLLFFGKESGPEITGCLKPHR